METVLKITVKTYELMNELKEILLKEYKDFPDNMHIYREVLFPIDLKVFAIDDDFVNNRFVDLIKHYGLKELSRRCKDMMSKENYVKLLRSLEDFDEDNKEDEDDYNKNDKKNNNISELGSGEAGAADEDEYDEYDDDEYAGEPNNNK